MVGGTAYYRKEEILVQRLNGWQPKPRLLYLLIDAHTHTPCTIASSVQLPTFGGKDFIAGVALYRSGMLRALCKSNPCDVNDA